jgi:hypothetical protein
MPWYDRAVTHRSGQSKLRGIQLGGLQCGAQNIQLVAQLRAGRQLHQRGVIPVLFLHPSTQVFD